MGVRVEVEVEVGVRVEVDVNVEVGRGVPSLRNARCAIEPTVAATMSV